MLTPGTDQGYTCLELCPAPIGGAYAAPICCKGAQCSKAGQLKQHLRVSEACLHGHCGSCHVRHADPSALQIVGPQPPSYNLTGLLN